MEGEVMSKQGELRKRIEMVAWHVVLLTYFPLGVAGIVAVAWLLSNVMEAN